MLHTHDMCSLFHANITMYPFINPPNKNMQTPKLDPPPTHTATPPIQVIQIYNPSTPRTLKLDDRYNKDMSTKITTYR